MAVQGVGRRELSHLQALQPPPPQVELLFLEAEARAKAIFVFLSGSFDVAEFDFDFLAYRSCAGCAHACSPAQNPHARC